MFNGKVQERLLNFTVRSTFVHRHLLPVDIWTVKVARQDNVLSFFMVCNLFKRLIESCDVAEIPMRHVLGAEVYILLVSCLHVSPNYFTVCGQLRLGVSYEAFFNGREYTTICSSASVVPMVCIARGKNFAGFNCILIWVFTRFDSSEPRFCSAYEIMLHILSCCVEFSSVGADNTAVHRK